VVGDLYSTDRPIALTGPLSAIISVHESKVSDSYAYATLVSTGVDGLDDGGLDKHGTISLRADLGAIWTATIILAGALTQVICYQARAIVLSVQNLAL
jgi:hypothetical protein